LSWEGEDSGRLPEEGPEVPIRKFAATFSTSRNLKKIITFSVKQWPSDDAKQEAGRQSKGLE